MEYKYIKHFPKPFLEDLVKNNVVPFIGAGFSKNAELPPNSIMPDWDQLGKNIASLINGYQYTNALDGISAFCHEYSKTKLIEKLNELLFIEEAKPGVTHKSFCELPFDIICTTNVEFLLEKGYELISRYCYPITDEDQLSINNNSKHGVSVIKIHGDLHHPKRIVMTEEDYDSYIEKNPLFSTFIANILISKTALFIGYSLDDYDFRQLWQLIKNRLGLLRRQAYVLIVDVTPFEISRYERRGVKVINIPGNKANYPEILAEIFQELNHYWSQEIFKYSTVTDEDRLIQLSLPSKSNQRLCFFSIPFKLLSFYKKYVFPIVENYGLVPITADEVVSAGDSILPKLSAILDRSPFIIADVSSKWGILELGMAKNKGDKSILIINEKDSPIPFDLSQYLYIQREKDPFENLDYFIQDIEKWLISISDNFDSLNSENESIRLLEKKEYRAAVISAVTHFEYALRKMLANRIDNNAVYSIAKMIDILLKEELLSQREYHDLREYISVRNQLVHSNETVSARIANKIVNELIKTKDKIIRKKNSRNM